MKCPECGERAFVINSPNRKRKEFPGSRGKRRIYPLSTGEYGRVRRCHNGHQMLTIERVAEISQVKK